MFTLRRLQVGVLSSMAVLAACGSSPGDVQVWTTADGDPVPPSLIQMRRGAEHCGWEDTWFLLTRNPGGTELEPVTPDTRQFVRDPDGALDSSLLKATYEADIDLPGDAVFTGYVSEGAELWVSEPMLDTAVFLVGKDGVERLPLADPPVYCD